MRKALRAAAGVCLTAGILSATPIGAWAATGGEILPAAGPLQPKTMQRLLLTDAAQLGSRIVAVGDHGYIVYTEDHGATWSRA